jgi:hypothetical protein
MPESGQIYYPLKKAAGSEPTALSQFPKANAIT